MFRRTRLSPFQLGSLSLLLQLLSSGSIWAADLPFASLLSSRQICASTLISIEDLLRLRRIVENDPNLSVIAKKLENVFLHGGKLGAKERAALDSELTQALASVRDRGLLPGLILQALETAKRHPSFPKELNLDPAVVVPFVNVTLDAELHARGFFAGGIRKAPFPSWTVLSERQVEALHSSGKSSISSGKKFLNEFTELTKSKFFPAQKLTFLTDAPSALTQLLKDVENARESVWLSTWAIYDDAAGSQITDLLIQRKTQGIDVRVIVDHWTSQRLGYGKNVQKLEESGVPTIRWLSEENPYFGQHGKDLIIDGRSDRAIVRHGGRNFGDVYYHTGAESSAKWDDADIELRGPVTREKTFEFARMWNDQVERLRKSGERSLERIEGVSRESRSFEGLSDAAPKVAWLEHTPNMAGEDPIYVAILKSIHGSEKSIDIANAYLILTPSLKEALIQARARGVRVRVYTNSMDSIDEKMIVNPILKSLAELLPSGVEVYLKRGSDTLHSKYAVFDKKLSMVKSYNLHPRSLRYEREVGAVVFDESFAQEVATEFLKSIEQAKKVLSLKDLGIVESRWGNLAAEVFFDQL